MTSVSLLTFSNYLVDKAVFCGFIGRHKVISLGIEANLLNRLAGVGGELVGEFEDGNVLLVHRELLCGLAAGADGCIGTTYNFLMPEVRAVYDAFRAGDIEGARKAQTVVSTIVDELIKYNVVLATKVILEAKGYDVNHPLYPMHDYTPEQKAEMLANLQKAGLKL